MLSPETATEIVHKAADCWSSGSADAFTALFLPDGIMLVPGQRFEGAIAIRQAFLDFSTTHTQVQIDIKNIVISGQQAAVEWTWQDVELETGKRSLADDAILIDFVGDKIQRWREYIEWKTD